MNVKRRRAARCKLTLQQPREYLLARSGGAYLSVSYDYYFVSDGEYALLMGNYHQRTGSVAADILEGLHKACETPQVDARLRFVEHGELRAACKHCSYLDTLSLAAGERRAHLAADVLLGAQTYLRQQTALLVRSELLACRKLQQVADGQPLEPYRLLERICNSQPCAPGDVKVGDVITVSFGQRELTVRVTNVLEHALKADASCMYEVVEQNSHHD